VVDYPPPAMTASRNVLGDELVPCGRDPLTGYFRDGCCRSGPDDGGRHVVCASMTEEFLRFSLQRGNDLVTPRPEWGFPGLKPGDRWCVCAVRWREALDAGKACPVFLRSTEAGALEYVRLQDLHDHALDAGSDPAWNSSPN